MPNAPQAIHGSFILIHIPHSRGNIRSYRKRTTPPVGDTHALEMRPKPVEVFLKMVPRLRVVVSMEGVFPCQPNRAATHNDPVIRGAPVIMDKVASILNSLAFVPSNFLKHLIT